MSAHFMYPWLLVLPLLGLLGGIALWFRLKKLQRWTATSWRLFCPGLAVVCLLVAMAHPSVSWRPKAGRVVVLLDVSASCRGMPWESAQWVSKTLAERIPAGVRMEIVGVGQTADLLTPIDSLEIPTDFGRADFFRQPGANFAAALAWRSEAEAKGLVPVAPRWIFTDGLTPLPAETTGYPLAVTVVPHPENQVDAGISQMNIRLQPGDETQNRVVEVWAEVRTTGAGEFPLQIFRDEKLIHEERVGFAGAGSRLVALRDSFTVATAPPIYELRIKAKDMWPEDDFARVVAPVPSHPQITVITHAPQMWEHFGVGQKPTIYAPEMLSTKQKAIFSPGKAEGRIFILDDLTAAELVAGGGFLDQLKQEIHDTGSGLLILGRTRAFGPGEYDTVPVLDELSPLASLVPPEQVPPREFDLLVDASGSMAEAPTSGSPSPMTSSNKFTFALGAIQTALRRLGAGDQLSVYTFAGTAQLQAQGSAEATLKELSALAPRIQPDGPTNPDLLLPLLAASINNNGEMERELILLTDGQIPAMDVAGWGKVLANPKTHLTIIAPAAPAGGTENTISKLAALPRVKWLAADQPAQWQELLTRAATEYRRGKVIREVRNWKPTVLAGTIKNPIQTGYHLETWARAEAKPVWVADQKGSMLVAGAVAQRGLGKVAGLSIAPPAENESAVLVGLLQEIAPGAGDGRFHTQMVNVPAPTLQVRGIENMRFMNNLRLAANLRSDGSGEPIRLELPQTAPGTYGALLPGKMGLPWSATIVQTTAEGERLVGHFNAPELAQGSFPATSEPVNLPNNIQKISLGQGDHLSDEISHLAPSVYDLRPLFYWLAVAVLFMLLAIPGFSAIGRKIFCV